MERLSRVILVLAVGLLVWQGYSWWQGSGVAGKQPLTLIYSNEAPRPKQVETCTLKSKEYEAQITAEGASVRHFWLLGNKYRKDGKAIDLATTEGGDDAWTDGTAPYYRHLRFHFRNEGVLGPTAQGQADPSWQVDYDLLFWKLEESSPGRCVLSYRSDRVELKKTFATTDHPYEVAVSTVVKNLAKEPRKHALTVSTTDWRTEEEVTGSMFRVSPFVTHVECIGEDGTATRLAPDSFEGTEPSGAEKGASPKPWEGEEFRKNPLNPGDWYQVPGKSDLAAVSNAYFTRVLIPLKAPADPVCQLQVEYRYHTDKYASRSEDPNGGSLYRARFAYPVQELKPGESTTYELLSYVGPKERDALAAIGGGQHPQALELIDLGFFSVIAKVLVGFLIAVYGLIPNWGVAIIVLTIVARTLLFPLMIPSIRMTVKMRQLKPELDQINEKFKDDAQAKGLATMELYKKHKVNLAMGCLPQLLTLPVWFALYTTLQTAVELYNTPFLWFPDLSERDPYFILPIVIGGTAFLQQKLMPMTGGDPTQQQMMLYFMPIMMTVFMLFLPSGLGIYMFTNSLLGIVQQQAVEWHVGRTTKKTSGDEPPPTDSEDTAKPSRKKTKKKGKGGREPEGSALASR